MSTMVPKPSPPVHPVPVPMQPASSESCLSAPFVPRWNAAILPGPPTYT